MGSWVFKKYFIGWSDVPDYVANAQGRLFYESEPVSAAFPEGLSSRAVCTPFSRAGSMR